MATAAPAAILIAETTDVADTSGKRDLNMAAGATIAVAFIALLLALFTNRRRVIPMESSLTIVYGGDSYGII